jgi:hypothetical protein
MLVPTVFQGIFITVRSINLKFLTKKGILGGRPPKADDGRQTKEDGRETNNEHPTSNIEIRTQVRKQITETDDKK